MAEAAAAAVAPPQPVSPQVVGNAFVQQYYHILHHSPALVHRFYQDISKLGRPEDDGSLSVTTTMIAINEKILSLNYGDFRAEIKSVDAQESFNGGVQVLVTGYLTGIDNVIRNFSQCFFLAPQDRGYFVLNDIFRYIESSSQPDGKQVLVDDVVDPVTKEQSPVPPTVQENHASDESNHVDEVTEVEVLNPPENGDVPTVEEEVKVPEVVDEVQTVQDDSPLVVESDRKVEEVQKKSYASIVMHLKEKTVSFSSPAPAPRKSPQKSQEQQLNPPPASETDVQIPSSDASDNGNIQEGEAGYSIYIKGLPMTATVSLLENAFNKFGPIRSGGIQVRSNRQQGFCFGFVEFEEPTAVEKALEASPIEISGRQTVVEEKRSTYSRGNNNRGRFQQGRGGSGGFRNEGMRGGGRGGYVGGGGRGGGYYRGDSNGRGEFNNRGGGVGGNKGRPSSRGGDGYPRADSSNGGGGGGGGGRINHRIGGGGGMANGIAKTTAPRISATA